MDDVARLRRTIYRCTAFLVAVVAVTGASIRWSTDGAPLVLLAVAAVGYLAVDSIDVTPATEPSDDESGSS